ncbi:dTDP-4-dehydrorhamnose reductase (plasmid) [Rhodovulum sp. P5]|uniref:dTDP-4-dehydrorhamnose reductase n=1 Tax=Rhodovulum sp. P5 TaxID=1564506 RepID=UPI0009C23373|nr:dTDP-4-dehydrorhamnose reductase [Rhodovulum sp. P5]ARE42539.1 dTDP-4-dehydrorhamnose reductase [Rhodovulum sp. P5]
MKVLLLGPNGQLGSDIQTAHAAAGEPFQLIPLERERLDVSDLAAIGPALNGIAFDVLVNCTSYHKTDEVEDNAALAFAVNAHGVEEMAKACAARGARFIHVSTDYVFGGDTGRTELLTEDAPTAPVNVYGASKAMGETLIRLACPDHAILRVSSLFGVAGASGKGGNFVETMIRVGRERGALKVVSDQIMTPTATADIADAILALLTRGAPSGTYHVAGTGAASWYDFACEIIRAAGVEATVTPCTSAEFPARAHRPAYSALDNGKCAREIMAMPPWQDALERYLKAKGHIG